MNTFQHYNKKTKEKNFGNKKTKKKIQNTCIHTYILRDFRNKKMRFGETEYVNSLSVC